MSSIKRFGSVIMNSLLPLSVLILVELIYFTLVALFGAAWFVILPSVFVIGGVSVFLVGRVWDSLYEQGFISTPFVLVSVR